MRSQDFVVSTLFQNVSCTRNWKSTTNPNTLTDNCDSVLIYVCSVQLVVWLIFCHLHSLSVCYCYYGLIQYHRETVSDIWITNANTSQFCTDTNTETFSNFFFFSWFPSRLMITKANRMPKDSDFIHRIKICFNAIICMNIWSHLYV